MPRYRFATTGSPRLPNIATADRLGLRSAQILLVLMAVVMGARPAAAAERAQSVGVTVVGSVPGIPDTALPAYLAREMAAANAGAWNFEPIAAGSTAPNRVEWSFKNLSSAVGSIRSYGFAQNVLQRLLGVRHYLSVEVTLYLNGEYQTQSLLQITTTGGDKDAELAAEITKGTRQLMAYPSLSGDAGASMGRRQPSRS